MFSLVDIISIPLRRAIALGIGIFISVSCGMARAQDVPFVAAASDLKFALDEVHAAFHARTGKAVKIVYGSSGNFYRQIAEGAPFQLFFSADEEYVASLAAKKLTMDDGILYAVGRIAVIVPKGSALRPDGELRDLGMALAANRIRKFAVANPEHAPYGRAAKQALEKARIWAQIEARLVIGENVSQAARFATSGSTDGGIIAYSLALAPQIGQESRYALIPLSLHAPLRQKMVRTLKAGATANAFYEFVRTSQARAILARHGFEHPTE